MEDAEPVRPEVEKRAVITGGILRDIRVVVGKDNNRMGFGVLEDKYDKIDVGLYGATYEKYKTLFATDAFVVVKGMLSDARDGYKITVRELIDPHSKAASEQQAARPVMEVPQSNVTLWLKMDERDDEKYAAAVDVLRQYEGEVPVKIKLEGKVFALETKVRRCAGIEYELGLILGAKNVVFFEK